MPATVTTKELFPLNTPQTGIDEEIQMRIGAGAIRSWSENGIDAITLFTEWNIIGQQ